jgi:hypothetical protein
VLGVIAIDSSTGPVTTTLAVPLILPEVAVIVAVPWAIPVTNPV